MGNVTGDTQPQHAEATAGEIPGQLTRLVGREQALSELRSLIWGTRLLTLCGPGGAGKTRLAAALAEAVRPDFVGGSWWVDLSATLDPGLVGQVVARTLLAEEPAVDPAPAAIAHRFSESTLLVLDNCEQIIDTCGRLVAALLERAPSLRVLATSRQPLGVPGEQVWRVPGLAVEPEQEGGEAGGVELFLERARSVASGFDPDGPGALDAVRRICRRLDGMPLAIELAAARTPILGVLQIAERIERDSGFLRHSSRTAPARHQTLPAMLDWSHRMLEPSERQLFRRLAAFRGSFSLTAAECICADDSLAEADVLDLLGALVDRSLVHVAHDDGLPRYRLLLTVRQYAAEQLDGSGENQATSERHARFFYELARDALARLGEGGDAASSDAIALEADNLREALRWLLDHAPADAARLASMLWPYCYRHGYYTEARMWLERALARSAEIPREVHAEALLRAGEVAFLQCDYGVAVERLHGALELIDEGAERQAAATALQRLGTIAREQGRYEEARDLHERSLAIWHDLGDAWGVARSQNFLGFVAWLSGDPWTAETLCRAALEQFQRAGALQDAAATLVNLGVCALLREELPLAEERLEEALSLSRSLGFQEGIAWALHELAIVGRLRRRPARQGAGMLREALLIHHRLGDRWRMASVLEEVAGGLLAREDPRRAVEVFAAADALRQRLGAPVPPAELGDRDTGLSRARAKLSDTQFQGAWSAGRNAELDNVVDGVAAAIEETGGGAEPAIDRRAVDPLTPRELAVLELLAAGATNREIAGELYISPSTAGVHVSNLLRKLGAKRRVDAAGLAHRLGLVSREAGAPARSEQPR